MAINPLHISYREIQTKPVRLSGSVSSQVLELDSCDELIHLPHPLEFELEAELTGGAILVQGSLSLDLECECARCLKRFRYPVRIASWAVHIPMEGEDSAPNTGDAVDLTPYVREDIVLAFPQHPLCESECNGLPGLVNGGEGTKSVAQSSGHKPASIWDQLDKLKIR